MTSRACPSRSPADDAALASGWGPVRTHDVHIPPPSRGLGRGMTKRKTIAVAAAVGALAALPAVASAAPTAPSGYTLSTVATAPTGASGPDDITYLDGHVFVGWQNGVGTKGEPGTGGKTYSPLVEYSRSGHAQRSGA